MVRWSAHTKPTTIQDGALKRTYDHLFPTEHPLRFAAPSDTFLSYNENHPAAAGFTVP